MKPLCHGLDNSAKIVWLWIGRIRDMPPYITTNLAVFAVNRILSGTAKWKVVWGDLLFSRLGRMLAI